MTVRRQIHVTGTVQGVGFRPFVYRSAVRLGLAGSVVNDGRGVVIEVEGSSEAVDALAREVRDHPPPLAHVRDVHVSELAVQGDAGFVIGTTDDTGPVQVPVAVDSAPCDACLAELADPADRRYRYPFVNCTDCGPRYTIVRRLPYDRPQTTMAGFPMCPPCSVEYGDPADRRFHAQPNACPECGPSVQLTDPAGDTLARGDAAMGATVTRLLDGEVVAIKGVGGYHLACLATDAAAVARLRQRKARDDKPFAVLVADLAAARDLGHLGAAEAAALTSAARPIVLVPRRADSPLVDDVAPRLAEVGLMLPPSPLHHLIATDVQAPLVLTSGNLAHEPIAHDDADAIARLAPLVDALLLHDRPIHIRCDDSVLRGGMAPNDAATSADVDTSGLLTMRRSRGLAPAPVPLPGGEGRDVLAVGGHLKNTVTVAKGTHGFVSHHVGDLDHPAAQAAFRQAIDHLLHLCDVRPDVVAHDLHPDYHPTSVAMELDLPSIAVQHHHAHVASCLVEHHRTDPVLGIAFDGLGLGPDGTLWGGEFLLADLHGYERVGHLRTVPQPGGDVATREPWRMTLAWVAAARDAAAAIEEGRRHDPRGSDVVGILDAPVTPITSSVGRLFDAAAGALGLAPTVTFEGQAAMELEALTAGLAPDLTWAQTANLGVGDGVLDPGPLILAVIAARDEGVPAATIAARFHDALAAGVVTLAADLLRAHGCATAVLTGGVFQNRRLTRQVAAGLRGRDVEVLLHGHVPCNDGGLSLGQAAVARLA